MSQNKEKHFWDETRKPWTDLENERDPIRPQKSGKALNRANDTTGVANKQMAGFFQDIVMEKAMKDRVAQFARIDTPDSSSAPQLGGKEETNCENELDWVDTFDDDIEAIRSRRLAELKKASATEEKLRGMGHGYYTEIVESEFLNSVIKSPRAVVHFYHRDFHRCKSVDKNLTQVAPLVLGSRFLKIDAEKCPFFVGKLNIRVLPSIVYFIDGKAVHTVTGFSEFGGNEDFSISNFLKSLENHSMLMGSSESLYSIHMSKSKQENVNRKEDLSDSD